MMVLLRQQNLQEGGAPRLGQSFELLVPDDPAEPQPEPEPEPEKVLLEEQKLRNRNHWSHVPPAGGLPPGSIPDCILKTEPELGPDRTTAKNRT